MRWAVETLNEAVDAEVEALPEDMRARLARIAKLIEEKGLALMGEPHVKNVVGQLWEMRWRGRSGISRALYVTAVGPACGDRTGIRKEYRENAAARDRSGSVAREA